MRIILHCDMNNFYASVECFLNPELKKYPIAVGGDVEERHGIILAKNHKAKAYGVTTGEAIWQAKGKCRDLVVVPPHYDEYMKFSKLAREIYGRYTEIVEPFGLDECWLDCSVVSSFEKGEEIANEIRETIKNELGLTISVGVSFNKIFAKLGSDMKKPDAVTVIRDDDFKDKIWNLPASDLLGVGRATTKVLNSFGIRTIGDMARWPTDFYKRKFGKRGIELWNFANGKDNSPVTVRDIEALDKSCGNGITTLQDLNTNEEVFKVMFELSQEIGHRLFIYNKYAKGIAIDIRDSDLMTKQWQSQLSFSTQSPKVIAKEAYKLFGRSYEWRKPIRSVTVRAINLVSSDEPEQIDLFLDTKRHEREKNLDRAIENIRSRFGSGIVSYAILLDNPKMPKHHTNMVMPAGIQI
ncbi:MAG: DNA polymerase IV [Clostridia bacterium]|nr:DNA polymerase IV [Clostridia bacterium]